jgi:hypothetical protein
VITDADGLLAARFAATRGSNEGHDWNDVLRRKATMQARSVHPRRLAVLAVGVCAAIGIAAPALGLYRPLLNFFDQPAAPNYVQMKFAQLDRGIPAGEMGPTVLTDETRQVMEAQTAAGREPLWVAPTRSGNFCWLWGDVFGGCTGTPLMERTIQNGERDPNALRLIYNDQWVAGVVLSPMARGVQIEFADGTTVNAQLVWVSAPVNASFFSASLVTLVSEHGAATAIVASDDAANIVSRALLSNG